MKDDELTFRFTLGQLIDLLSDKEDAFCSACMYYGDPLCEESHRLSYDIKI